MGTRVPCCKTMWSEKSPGSLTSARTTVVSPAHTTARINRSEPERTLFGIMGISATQAVAQVNRESGSTCLHSPVGAPEEHGADCLEDEVGQPENQMWRELRPILQGLTDDDKTVIHEREDQCHRNAGAGFAPVRADAERDANEREADATKG